MENKRLLVISDDQDLSTAYQAILAPVQVTPPQNTSASVFETEFIDHGKQGLLLVKESLASNSPFAAVFIKTDKNSSWNEIKTATEIRKIDPDIEIVLIIPDPKITRDKIILAVGSSDKLLFSRRPYDPDEFLQIAAYLTSKWTHTAKATILNNNQTRFNELTTANREFVWEIDVNGNFTYCSNSCKTVLGYTPEELLGENIFNKLVPVTEQEQQKKLFKDTIKKEKSHLNVQRKALNQAGELIYINTSCIPLVENGKVTACRGLDRDITQTKNLELQLELKTMEFAEVNNALKVLLEQSTEAISEHERKIYDNLQRLVFPYFDKLATKNINQEVELYINVIRANLEKITSTFNLKVSSRLSGLTPREIQVAELIKQGKSTKEMSTLLGLSSRTIEFYRDKLRVKLGIKKKKVNLRSHLASIS